MELRILLCNTFDFWYVRNIFESTSGFLFLNAFQRYPQVIDEADRLVTQTFQDWLAQVLAATQPSPIATIQSGDPPLSDVPIHDALSPAWLPLSRSFPTSRTDIEEKKESSCQKLLFSATLTRDPSKIAALNLRNAKYFVVGGEDQIRGGEGGDGMVGEAFAFPELLKVCVFHPCSLSKYWLCSCTVLGTYDRVRFSSEASDVAIPDPCTLGHQRSRVHEICRIHNETCQAYGIL